MRAIYFHGLVVSALAISGCGNSPEVDDSSADSQTGTNSQTVEATGDVGELVKKLTAADAKERRVAIDSLADLGAGADSAVEPLTKLLADEDAVIRAHAARALGKIGEAAKPSADALAKAMADEDEDVRLMAVGALASIKPGKDKVVPLLLKALEGQDFGVVLRATEALSSLGPDVVDPMVEALGNEKTAYWAILVLHGLGPDAKPAVPAILKVLDGGQPETQLLAVETLGEIGDESAIPKLIEVLKDHPFDIEINAAFALSKFGPAAKDAAEHLEKGLKSDDEAMRTVCAYSLAMIFPEDEARKTAAIGGLLKALQSEEQRIRVAAAGALIRLNPDPEILKAPFLKAFESADEDTRIAMFAAVGSIGEEVVPRLQRALKEPAVRRYAATALGEMGPKAAAAVPDMVAALDGESAEVREQILMAIGHVGEGIQAAAPAAKAALADEDVHVKRAGIYVLGRLGADAKDSAGDLFALLAGDKKDEELATFAAWALAAIEPGNADYAKESVSLLAAALQSPRIGIRIEAAEALGQLGGLAKDAVSALEAAGEGASAEEKAVYADVIKQIQGS